MGKLAKRATAALKAKVCGERTFEKGDIVRVTTKAPRDDWPETEHPLGGAGRWGIYVGTPLLGKGKNSPQVRPLLPDGDHGKPQSVERMEHVEDVVSERAREIGMQELRRRRRERATR